MPLRIQCNFFAIILCKVVTYQPPFLSDYFCNIFANGLQMNYLTVFQIDPENLQAQYIWNISVNHHKVGISFEDNMSISQVSEIFRVEIWQYDCPRFRLVRCS